MWCLWSLTLLHWCWRSWQSLCFVHAWLNLGFDAGELVGHKPAMILGRNSCYKSRNSMKSFLMIQNLCHRSRFSALGLLLMCSASLGPVASHWPNGCIKSVSSKWGIKHKFWEDCSSLRFFRIIFPLIESGGAETFPQGMLIEMMLWTSQDRVWGQNAGPHWQHAIEIIKCATNRSKICDCHESWILTIYYISSPFFALNLPDGRHYTIPFQRLSLKRRYRHSRKLWHQAVQRQPYLLEAFNSRISY